MQIRAKKLIIAGLVLMAATMSYSLQVSAAGVEPRNGVYYCIGSDGVAGREATEGEKKAGVCTGDITASAPTSRDTDSSASTVILTECGGKEGTESVRCLLKMGLNIFSVVVGIVGVIGIVIFGIQYMTAGGNEQKTTKAKRRVIELVIGLAIYVSLYALARWFGFLA